MLRNSRGKLLQTVNFNIIISLDFILKTKDFVFWFGLETEKFLFHLFFIPYNLFFFFYEIRKTVKSIKQAEENKYCSFKNVSV